MAKLEFHNVTVAYPIYNVSSKSIRNQLIRLGTGGRIASEAGKVTTITALDNISFSLRDGDAVGLLGHNGAGKSTLLRTMAGVYQPVSGRVVRDGAVTTVFELGAGMDMELSGYDNIVRVMMLLGYSRKRAELSFADIEEFTELGDFLKMPVRTYSSGMTTRLMFAVATLADPAIMLLDEIFGTGDAKFHIKSRQRIERVISTAKILVFASHDTNLIKQFCNRLFRLENGQIEEVSFDVI
jgi:ABC-type polysaccharide/polyol phosphate transport system ATPase subunit